jgi:tagaturonate reductase
MFDELNRQGLYDGGIVVVQPLPSGLVDKLNEQDGLYTLLLRGLEEGKPVTREKVVTNVTRGINPYEQYEAYIEIARNPDLRFVVSNTTEAGIAYSAQDKPGDKPQVSFPGKVTAFLYERYQTFSGALDKGLVFIPCELIDNNGRELRKIVLRLADEWQLGDGFVKWIETACIFTSTLVDRIVTGYPRDEAAEICERLGYIDEMLDTGEIFHFWVIEGPTELADELPFAKAGLNVLFTPDVTPYKQRKVRILNGAHTSLIPAALLCGLATVGESMADPTLRSFTEHVLYDEVIPTLTLNKDDLMSFAKAVFDRFGNPFIKHQLTSIALNTTSKWKARVLPSVERYLEIYGKLPERLTFSFAASLELFDSGRTDISDTDDIQELWAELKDRLPGFEDAVNEYRSEIKSKGCRAVVEKLGIREPLCHYCI